MARHISCGQTIRRVKLKPKSLRFSELAILANVVHQQGPIYSLLKTQDYWYANIIFDSILSVYPYEDEFRDRDGILTKELVYLPANDYFPNLTGRWISISVGRVESVILPIVVKKFREDCERLINAACFAFILNQYSLTPKRL